eukprot:5180686-Pyramimonas_sp.AAC.1
MGLVGPRWPPGWPRRAPIGESPLLGAQNAPQMAADAARGGPRRFQEFSQWGPERPETWTRTRGATKGMSPADKK